MTDYWLHRIWLGPHPMPERFKCYGQLWEELNPDLVLNEWSWHNLPEVLPCKDVIDDLYRRCTSVESTELPTQIADILGYWLVLEYGGIYANADINPFRPIPEHMWDRDFVTFEEKNYPLKVNAFIGGIEGSEFWKSVLDGIPDRYFSNPEAEMVFTTGPRYLTEKVDSWSETDVTIYPYSTVNPILWKDVPLGSYGSEVFPLDKLPADSIGIHDWHHRFTQRSNVVH